MNFARPEASSLAAVPTGYLAGLGKTNLGGTVQGTGFVARGNESMSVTLRTPRGTITFDARSDQVPGFTSP